MIIDGLLHWYRRKPLVEPPPGITIMHTSELGWIFEDQKGMFGAGYLTRRGAIRGAQAEYNNKEKTNE